MVATSRTAGAWDGRRGGFILGLDVGGGMAHVFHAGAAAGKPSSSTRGGFALSFEIGGAVSDHLRLAFAPELVVYDFERVGTAYKNILKPPFVVFSWVLAPMIPLVGSQALLGAKATYFLQPEAPSAYVAGSLGPAVFADVLDDEVRAGIGFGVDGGYEFARHWDLSLSFIWTSSLERGGPSAHAFSLLARLGAVGY